MFPKTTKYRRISAYKMIKFNRLIAATRNIASASQEHVGFVSRTEADTHADTFVAGKNCIPMNYTDRSCDVQPYSDDYAPMRTCQLLRPQQDTLRQWVSIIYSYFPRLCGCQGLNTVCLTPTSYGTTEQQSRTTHIQKNL